MSPPVDDLDATLRAHGFDESAIAIARRIGTAIRTLTLADGLEYAALIDAATGEKVGATLRGGQQAVDVSPLIDAMSEGSRYALLHTHPRSSSFSGADARTLLDVDALQAMVAIGADGTWYVLSRHRRQATAQQMNMELTFEAAVLGLRPRYQALVTDRVLNPFEAWRALTHEVWQSVASELGLLYDRIEVILSD